MFKQMTESQSNGLLIEYYIQVQSENDFFRSFEFTLKTITKGRTQGPAVVPTYEVGTSA